MELPTGINQGCPLSLLAYLYYKPYLVETATTARKDQRITYCNGKELLARGKNFEEASRTMVDMMTREDGALQWAMDHDMIFEIDMTTMLGFIRKKDNDHLHNKWKTAMPTNANQRTTDSVTDDNKVSNN